MKEIQKFVDEAMNQRAKILYDFCKAYLASRAEWFMEKPERIARVMLVETVTPDGLYRKYHFEARRGRGKADGSKQNSKE